MDERAENPVLFFGTSFTFLLPLSYFLILSSMFPLFFLNPSLLCSFLILPSNQTSKPFLSSICASIGDCDPNNGGSNDEDDANHNGLPYNGYCSLTWMTQNQKSTLSG